MFLNHTICKLVPKLAQVSNRFVPAIVEQKIINKALNTVLSEQLIDGELDFLEGQFLEVKVTDINVSWFFTVIDEQIFASNRSLKSDAAIIGDFNSFVLLASQKADPDTLFFRRKLVIEGDMELGLAIKNLLDQVELSQLPTLLTKPLLSYANTVEQQEQVAEL